MVALDLSKNNLCTGMILVSYRWLTGLAWGERLRACGRDTRTSSWDIDRRNNDDRQDDCGCPVVDVYICFEEVVFNVYDEMVRSESAEDDPLDPQSDPGEKYATPFILARLSFFLLLWYISFMMHSEDAAVAIPRHWRGRGALSSRAGRFEQIIHGEEDDGWFHEEEPMSLQTRMLVDVTTSVITHTTIKNECNCARNSSAKQTQTANHRCLAIMHRRKGLWIVVGSLVLLLLCGLLLTQPIPFLGLTQMERIVIAEQLRRQSLPCTETTAVKVLGLFSHSQEFLVSCGPIKYASWVDPAGMVQFAQVQADTRR